MYPRWLPSPKAFGQAIVFSLQLIPVMLIIRVLDRSLGFFVLFTENIKLAIGCAIFLLFSLIYLLSMVDQFLWRKTTNKSFKWIPCWRSIGEGLWGFFLFLFSVGLAFLFTLELRDLFTLSNDDCDAVAGSLTMVFMAYGFHIRNSLFPNNPKEPKQRKEPKQKPEKVKQPINPIEQELNELKSELGFKSMNNK